MREAAVQALGQLGDARAMLLVVRRAQHLRWRWALLPLALLHGLTDWPVLIGFILAQVVLLAPTVGAILPPPITWLFGLNAWWQVVLLVLLCIGTYLGSWFARRWILYKAQDDRAGALAAAEQLIRRQVADTNVRSKS